MRTQFLVAKPKKYARDTVEREVKTAIMAKWKLLSILLELLLKLFGKDYY
jgi:hypothetical protein